MSKKELADVYVSDNEPFEDEYTNGRLTVMGPKKFAKALRRMTKNEMIQAIDIRDQTLVTMTIQDLQTIARTKS